MRSQQNEADVFEDHTVKSGKTQRDSAGAIPIQPGPSGDRDERSVERDEPAGSGFSSVPGAGPNPTR